ncbi:hypothetical protein CJU89_0843 [Yarrowia sp. B02]|nr:hypothetical protein CJU89_0843 [Yarrowia sp. B02]
MDSNMKEATQKTVKLPMAKKTLEVILQYLYGERLNLTFGDAARLIVFAQMYDLPELLELATAFTVYLWRKSFEAQNDDVREYASKRIEELRPEVEDFDAKIEHLDKTELIAFFSDVSYTMSKRRKTG